MWNSRDAISLELEHEPTPTDSVTKEHISSSAKQKRTTKSFVQEPEASSLAPYTKILLKRNAMEKNRINILIDLATGSLPAYNQRFKKFEKNLQKKYLDKSNHNKSRNIRSETSLRRQKKGTSYEIKLEHIQKSKQKREKRNDMLIAQIEVLRQQFSFLRLENKEAATAALRKDILLGQARSIRCNQHVGKSGWNYQNWYPSLRGFQRVAWNNV